MRRSSGATTGVGPGTVGRLSATSDPDGKVGAAVSWRMSAVLQPVREKVKIKTIPMTRRARMQPRNTTEKAYINGSIVHNSGK
jgi:hypothetical protein